MKRFTNPQMTLVHLASKSVIYSSCNSNTCYGFEDCPIFTCPDCECDGFGACLDAFKCGEGFTCGSYT